jgi:hypothetical protein
MKTATVRRLRRGRRKRPEFAARLKRIYGDKIFSRNIVVEEREEVARTTFPSRQSPAIESISYRASERFGFEPNSALMARFSIGNPQSAIRSSHHPA